MKPIQILLISLLLLSTNTFSQKEKDKSKVSLKFRNIGPAFASGRVSDFAVNPNNHSEYYVAFAAGNIWKTINNGTTFTPVFYKKGSYSIGC